MIIDQLISAPEGLRQIKNKRVIITSCNSVYIWQTKVVW